MFTVFDLDGTISNDSHRKHLLPKDDSKENKDWYAYSTASISDPPIIPIVTILRQLVSESRIEIWTGRSADYWDITVQWLANNFIIYDRLRMRPSGDKRTITEIKGEWLADGRPDLIFEDYTKLVNFYRSKGIICCQVAERA